MVPRWFVLTVGGVALALWVASFVVTLYNVKYKPDPIIGYAAMAVVSACFTGGAIKNVAERFYAAENKKARVKRKGRRQHD